MIVGSNLLDDTTNATSKTAHPVIRGNMPPVPWASLAAYMIAMGTVKSGHLSTFHMFQDECSADLSRGQKDTRTQGQDSSKSMTNFEDAIGTAVPPSYAISCHRHAKT